MSEQHRQKQSGRAATSRNASPSLEEKVLEAPITVSWVEAKGFPQVTFTTTLSIKWTDIYRLLPLKEGVARNRVTLSRMFANALANEFRPAIEGAGPGPVAKLRGRLDAAVFDRILRQLESGGAIEAVAGPKYVKQRSVYWTLTPEGARRVSEAQR